MTVNRTTLLDLPLPVTGTESGTWGDTTNNGLTQYLDIAIAGTLVLSTDADVTLTSTEGDSSATNIGATTAQYAILRWTATGSTTRNITALAQSKTYVVINATGGTQSIVLRGAGPTTGVTIISGEKAYCVWNGSDFVKVSSSAAAGGSNTQVQYNSSGVLAGSSNLTFDGTSLTLGGNPTLSAGTANGVLYLNGSKVATSGSALTFDGTTFAVTNASASLALSATKSADGNTAFFRRVGGTYNPGMYISLSDTVNNEIIFNTAYSSGNAPAYVWQQAGTEQMRLTSTGLGIGTSSPAQKLSLSASAANVAIRMSSVGGTGRDFDLISNTAGNLVVKSDLQSNILTYDGILGNLGLGVTPNTWNSLAKVVETGSGGLYSFNTIDTELFQNCYLSQSSGWIYKSSNFANRYSQYNGEHIWFTAPSGTAGNAITFSQVMTLDASGNLGVGTTSPGQKVDVAGKISTVVAGGGTHLLMGNSYATVSLGSAQNAGLDADMVFYTQTSTERMRLNSSGNLGLGVTPSAWTSYKAMQLAGNNFVYGFNNDELGTGQGSYYNSGWKYAETGIAASRYAAYRGTHAWYIAPSGTAGNAITFTQAMTLDASGNLLIGQTSGADAIEATRSGSSSTGLVLNQTGTSGRKYIISSTGTGYGSAGNLIFYDATAAAERARITSGGNFKIGGTADRGTTEGDKQLVLFNGTAPVGTLTNGISLYSSSGEAYVMDAAGNATLFSPHDRDTNEWIFRSKHTPSGKVLKIDVERLLRFVNDHFGLDAVQEFIEP